MAGVTGDRAAAGADDAAVDAALRTDTGPPGDGGGSGPRHAAPGAVPVRPVEPDSSPRHAAPENGPAAGSDSEDKA